MSTELGLAKLETKMEMILHGQDRAEQSRKELHQSVNALDKKVDGLEFRMQAMETSFKEARPTIDDFIATKHKVQGAGQLGKFLWTIGGLLLGAAAWATGIIQSIINGLGK